MDLAALLCGGLVIAVMAVVDRQPLWSSCIGGLLMGLFGGWFAAYVRRFKKSDIGALGTLFFLIAGLAVTGWEPAETMTKRLKIIVYGATYIAVAFSISRCLLKKWTPASPAD
jgi:hypothetical protein